MTTQTDLSPIGIRDLPDGTLPCWACGLPVTDGTVREARIFARHRKDGLGERIEDVNGTMTIDLSECAHCAELAAQAAHVIETHQGLRRKYGSLKILSERLAHALIAMDALDLSQPVWTYESIESALYWLESAGASMTFASRYSPVREFDAKDGQAASERYLFASVEVRNEAKRGYLETLVDARGPKPQPCPTGACASCGVATFNARRMREAWVEAPSKYAGRHICATCESHREEGGVMGIGMLERCVLDAADPTRELRHKRFDVPSVKGASFYADSGRTKPNPTPWAHLDLEALRRSIAGSTW